MSAESPPDDEKDERQRARDAGVTDGGTCLAPAPRPARRSARRPLHHLATPRLIARHAE